MSTLRYVVAVAAVALLWAATGAEEARAQTISTNGGYYTAQSSIAWFGTYSVPPGVTVSRIEAYSRPSTSGTWSISSTIYTSNPNWSATGGTDWQAAGTFAVARLWYWQGGFLWYIDSNVIYIDSPFN